MFVVKATVGIAPCDDTHMDKTAHGWKIVDADAKILTYTYSFGPGLANALAVKGDDGMIVVSPPCNVAAGVYDDLADFGPVRALVASNAFHHMGMPCWREKFPAAKLFAPAQSIARVKKHTKLDDVAPLSDAKGVAGANVDLVDLPHYKTGEVLVRIKHDRGTTWYVTDFLMNLPSLPPGFLFRTLFKWTGSAPGLKFNNVAPMFMVKDKKALKRWLAGAVDEAPPTRLVPAHGDVVDLSSEPKRLREIFVS
jgi:hypothetical protein